MYILHILLASLESCQLYFQYCKSFSTTFLYSYVKPCQMEAIMAFVSGTDVLICFTADFMENPFVTLCYSHNHGILAILMSTFKTKKNLNNEAIKFCIDYLHSKQNFT